MTEKAEQAKAFVLANVPSAFVQHAARGCCIRFDASESAKKMSVHFRSEDDAWLAARVWVEKRLAAEADLFSSGE